ncbi:hypothetical protein [Gymnodinialimonas hymeniacidonis]|uniref:hypothetical protein n=1 Tax=Gymnodinialimonas hymeniacidonis TaxID=3126508 RepID=UPI0034C610F6
MRWFIAAALCALGLDGAAQAQIELDYAERVNTRFGEIHAVGADFQFTLWHNQTQLPLPEDGRWWVNWHQPSEGDFDWVLASHHHGGNSCGGAAYLLRVGADGVAAGQPISDCDGLLLDIRAAADWVEVDRMEPNILVTHVTIRWQGDAYTETLHYAPPAEAAGAGADVTRWLGEHAANMLEDPSERARFESAMQVWEMQDLWVRLLVGTSVAQQGDWVFATGCQPHACGLDMGAIGIRISDGAVAAVIRSSGNPDRTFGLADAPSFRAAIADGFE